MVSKWKFIDIYEHSKKLAFLIKTALIKAFTYNYLKNIFLSDNLKTNIFNKINKSTTRILNSYFILITIVFCLSTIAFSYYEQRNKFNQELVDKTKFTYLHIEETFKNYRSSLDTLTKVMLKDQKYRDNNRVIELLKLTFTNDEHISLIPLTWHSMDDINKSFNAYGGAAHTPDKILLEKLDQLKSFFIYDQLNEKGETTLLLVLPLLEQSNITKIKNSNLVGYLMLPIRTSSLLRALSNNFSDGDILKINKKASSIYFIKRQNSLNNISKPSLEKYSFANDVSILDSPYAVSGGKDKSVIMDNTIQIALQRCAIILSLSFVMLLIYNLVERRRIKKQCAEFFNEEVLLLEKQVTDLNIKLNDLNQKNIDTANFIQKFHHADEIIANIEHEIKQGIDDSIQAVKDLLNFKQLKNNDDLTIDMINKVFGNINAIVENLSNNIVNNEGNITEVNLFDLFAEVLAIFEPIISKRSITVINKVGNIKVHIDELTLKQILITLLNKALYFIPSDSTITIAANKSTNRNFAVIEITDNGIGFNDLLFKERSYQSKNELFPRVNNIELEGKAIESLVKTNLKGDLKIDSSHSSNKITLLFPIEQERADKVIPFPKIVGGSL